MGLPDDFRFHDLRHYFASLLIASGLDVKVVQARLRHASAKTTLDTYGHLWPDRDDTSRAAVAAVYQDWRSDVNSKKIAVVIDSREFLREMYALFHPDPLARITTGRGLGAAERCLQRPDVTRIGAASALSRSSPVNPGRSS